MTSSRVSGFMFLCLLLLVVVATPGCAAIAGIFKAGMWVGVIIAVIVIGGAMMLFSRMR